ncbi:MAG: hypothetical protein IPO67_08290 [Deltaproteobacteria bacterium]|nr:hypothetical protein [Deltaproteobacteria bacterium]
MVLTRRAALGALTSALLSIALVGVTPGCLPKTAPVRASAATPTALCVVLTKVNDGTLTSAPASLNKGLEEELVARNLTPSLVEIDAAAADAFRARRSTPQRVEWLVSKRADAALIVLVEAQVEYYTQMSGRFRWTVDVRVTASPASDLSQAVQSEFSVPVALQYQHEREEVALEEAGPVIERQVASVLDQLVGGLSAP